MSDGNGHAQRHDVTQALGDAVIALWGDLPQNIQQRLFESAAGTDDDGRFRTALALYLHDHHPRTSA